MPGHQGRQQQGRRKRAGAGPKEFTAPICVWADYSTVGVVIGIDLGQAMAGKGMPQDDVAALAAKLYNTSRTKI